MSSHQSPSKKRAAEDSEHEPKKTKSEAHSPASRTRSKGGAASAASETASTSAESSTNKTPAPDMAPVTGQNMRYHTMSCYLPIQGAADAVEWYKKIFNAREVMRFDSPDHKIIYHAELAVGDSIFMVSEDMGASAGAKNPKALGGASIGLCLQVPDVDTSVKLALDNGAKEIRKIENQFYGDRNGVIADPFGHTWTIGTTIKEVTRAEMNAFMAAMGQDNKESNGAAHNGKEKA